jgi:hypothetical protein
LVARPTALCQRFVAPIAELPTLERFFERC